ncbi:MAG: cbb3-type cytochrome c oxidase subunit I [Syntrophaceae bacterium]
MPETPAVNGSSFSRWRISVLVIFCVELAVLIWIAARTYEAAPPLPAAVITPAGRTLFTGRDIIAGQEIFLRYGLMQNGSIWGHGACLGPDFPAEYLHSLATDTGEIFSRALFNKPLSQLGPVEREMVHGRTALLLKQNRYDEAVNVLRYTAEEASSYESQLEKWRLYFTEPALNRGLLLNQISDPDELRKLTSFFAWTAWASAANRPGENYSYTNNVPYEPAAGNRPTSDAILWSALSVITLLGGTAIVLFAFGRFKFLGWKPENKYVHSEFVPLANTPAQKSVMKFFVLASVLFLAQVLAGGMTAHYRADPRSFYGIDVSSFFPGNIFRVWHLQLALFWITICLIAGGLFLSGSFGKEPRGQARNINILFWALVAVVFGSLLGEMLGILQLAGDLWYWFGNQGWEYLDLGRGWQYLLAAGLVFWVWLLIRQIRPALREPAEREMPWLFLLTSVSIPVFYLPALFFMGDTHFSIVDNWRFWIIHLWVEYFLELFVTVMVAVLLFKIGLVSRTTATRVIYMDAILFPAGGIIGTGHHWYWNGGQPAGVMAITAAISALEVVPLILLTLDAWDFIALTRGKDDTGASEKDIPHKWTFYFLMAVGFWNFIGAGVFGFLINMPIVSYFETGTNLTPNHGHAALMGVFGMFAISFMVFGMRQVSTDREWAGLRKYVRTSFWGLNAGLLLMVVLNLFPSGVLQFLDVLNNGYWHARGPGYMDRGTSIFLEWLRLPADLIFIILGVVPMVIAMLKTYMRLRGREQQGRPYGKL